MPPFRQRMNSTVGTIDNRPTTAKAASFAQKNRLTEYGTEVSRATPEAVVAHTPQPAQEHRRSRLLAALRPWPAVRPPKALRQACRYISPVKRTGHRNSAAARLASAQCPCLLMPSAMPLDPDSLCGQIAQARRITHVRLDKGHEMLGDN